MEYTDDIISIYLIPHVPSIKECISSVSILTTDPLSFSDLQENYK